MDKILKVSFKNKKLISSLVIIGILVPAVLFSAPKKADATITGWISDAFAPLIHGTTSVTAIQTTAGTGLQLKALAKEVFREVLRNLAKRVINKMTESTINWINSGFHGAPLFLESPQSFFKDIAKYEIRNFVDTIGYDSLRFPFGKDFALNVIYTYKRQFTENAQYSLSRVTNDQAYLNSFRNDFSVGGWDGFLLHTQYPQNNPIGSRMIYAEELARRIDGTQQNLAQETRTKLEQGAGFLSPQTCPTNERYDNLRSAFNPPTFKTTIPYEWEYDEGESEEFNAQDKAAYDADYNAQVAEERAEWEEEVGCPGGLRDTTPGSVVGAQITNALTSGQRQGELAIAMGNSVSAILDSLLNHFINKGLSALSTKVNPPPEQPDEWDYFGNTLGFSSGSNNEAWNAGPDEVIVLSEFKNDVQNDITNTEIELALLNNLGKVLTDTWQQIRQLDQCVPGPDIKWEERLEDEKTRNASKMLEKSSDDDPNEASRAREANRELSYAVSFFKDWIQSRMLEMLPSSPIYVDTVQGIETIYQQSAETIEARRRKTSVLSRLKSIQVKLATIASGPAPGSAEEDRLIAYKKEYNATRTSSSNAISVEDTRNEYDTAVDKLNDIADMADECGVERAQNGWGPVDTGGNGSATGVDKNGRRGTEKELFCDFPVVGGFSHEMFKNPVNPPQYGTGAGSLPMVNANNVFKYDKAFGSGQVSIKIKCSTVFRANILDYKGDIPGVTTLVEEPAPPGDVDDGGPSESEGGEGQPDPDSEPASLYAQVVAEREKYGATITKAQMASILTAVAANNSGAGWGVLDKPGGNNCPSGDFDPIACDILFHGPSCYLYDVFKGSNNPDPNQDSAEPAWGIADGNIPRSRWRGQGSGGDNIGACAPWTISGGSGSGSAVTPYNPTPISNPNPGSGNPFISSITPTTATSGVTTLTIRGTNLSTVNKTNVTTVRFYYGLSGRTSVDGTVNSVKTEVQVLVPAEINTTNATVKIYRDGSTESNAYQIQISGSVSSGSGTATVASFDATSGWGGNLAYNSVQNNWLVVSAGTNGINGKIMSNSGTPVTSEFTINQTSGVHVMYPTLAYAPDINKYLVVWIGFPDVGTIYGRFVNADGSLSGNAFTIFRDPANTASFLHPNSKLGYDDKNNKFVFVWDYRHPTPDVNLVTIDQSGNVGAVIKVGVDANGESWMPSLAINENANEYCVAYDKRNSGNRVTAVRKLNAATLALGTETVSSSAGMYTSIVYNTVGNKYLIGWNSGLGLTSEAKILNSCDINNGGTVFTSNNTGQTQTLAYNSKSNNYASIVQTQADSSNAFNILSSTGAKIKSGIAFAGGNGNFFPVIAPNTSDGSFAATSAREYTVTRFAPNIK